MRIEPDQAYTVKEVADLMKVTETTIRRWGKGGTIKIITLGERKRILGSEILRMYAEEPPKSKERKEIETD